MGFLCRSFFLPLLADISTCKCIHVVRSLDESKGATVHLAKPDLILTHTDQTCTLPLENHPRHAQTNALLHLIRPEDEEALTLVRCLETSLRGKRNPGSSLRVLEFHVHWWKHCLTDFELSTQSSGRGRCVACWPETGNTSLLWAQYNLKLFQLYRFFWIWYDLILSLLLSKWMLGACTSKRNRSCTEFPAQHQPLCLRLFRGPSLVGSCSWHVFISKLVRDLAHSYFMTEDSAFFSRLPSVPFLLARPALWAHPETSAVQTVPLDHLLRLWPVAFALLPWALQWLPVPKKQI